MTRKNLPVLLLVVALAVTGGVVCNAQPTCSPFKGAISGRSLDEDGRPLANQRVVAGRWSYHAGRKQFQPLSVTTSGQDGGYVINDLDPGTYYIRTGLSAPEFHLRGKFVDPRTGRFISLKEIKRLGSPVGSVFRIVRVRLDQTFEVDHLLPGTYANDDYSNDYTARLTVTITDRDVDNVVVELTPCPKIRGTMTIDGTPVRPTSANVTDFMLTHLDEAVSIPGVDDGDGTFYVRCAQPEIYSIDVPLQPGTYLKSITLDGKDATNAPLDLTSARGQNSRHCAIVQRRRDPRHRARFCAEARSRRSGDGLERGLRFQCHSRFGA